MAGLEMVEVMLMRRLRWLGHVARMEETRIPVFACEQVGQRQALSWWTEEAVE